jgi:hypothetical protein
MSGGIRSKRRARRSSALGASRADLLVTAALGLIFLSVPERRQRAWYRVLLSLTLMAAVAGTIFRSPATDLAADYLLLGFFCITLYYQERLPFISDPAGNCTSSQR